MIVISDILLASCDRSIASRQQSTRCCKTSSSTADTSLCIAVAGRRVSHLIEEDVIGTAYSRCRSFLIWQSAFLLSY